MSDIQLTPDPTLWLAQCRTTLEQREAFHNLILALGTLPAAQEHTLYASGWRAGNLVLAALKVGFPKLVLATPIQEDQPSTRELAKILAAKGEVISEVVGESELAATFIAAWQQETGQTVTSWRRQGLYALYHVQPVVGVAGTFRWAESSDREWLIAAVLGFKHELTPQAIPDQESIGNDVDRRLKQGVLGVWDIAGQPVSMAIRVRQTRHGAAVSLVYTPPKLRGHGYASACVAALSQKLLDQGNTFCCLYTDLANPVSNHIYQQIGYEWLGESSEYRLENTMAAMLRP